MVMTKKPVLKYLLTYKMSQDHHLELFFSAVQTCTGWNNHPTTHQFVAAYKQLLMRHNIEARHGNCVKDQSEIEEKPTGISDVAIARRYDLELRGQATLDHDYCNVSNAVHLSEYKEAAISYIARYVVKMVMKKINCTQCRTVLTTMKEGIPDLFVTRKTNWRLKLPFGGLIKICEETEKCIMNSNHRGSPRSPELSGEIVKTVLETCVKSRVLSTLDQHMFDLTVVDNHHFM